MKKLGYILLLILAFGYFISCEDEKYLSSSDVKLRFSVDTVMFDTVFTTIGSTTQHLKIYNPYKQKVLISSVKLAKGEMSNFRLNINGVSANEVYDLEIAPFDSLYIFVEVTIDPSGQNLPLVVKDSIVFVTNSNRQDVDLVAWGQDFVLIRQQRLKNTTWTNEKPYLVYNYAFVDSNATLTIEPGTKIYFHKEAGLYVKGKVLAKGTVENPIVFHGDRLEDVYSNVPDQWNGILLYSGSLNNEFTNVEIKNANIGLQVGNIENEGYASVKLTNAKIQNMAYAGIFAMKSEIIADNCLITNCGFYAVALLVGGSYEFNHSTIANYWGGYGFKARSTPSLQIQNYLIISKDKPAYIGDLSKANFGNCIIAGNIIDGNELLLGKRAEALFNYKFDKCLIQVADTFKTSNADHFVNILKGLDPKFVDPYKKYNFELDTLSPAKDAGRLSIGRLVPTDLKGRDRLLDKGPDLGALERQEKKAK
ncbi:MAG: right-handed parallel beta-helix repeat-containing protein [Bacteroidota bacterium]|nr:right-handed parallel beta-helix repeat-containing protein [Bacteroidota bacterium]MDP3916516.1 right-handed parallel beta-helix repeat-containing protein [Bacteroidota bacterium]